ncbi:CaiB/BaiF CoA transferase family protein [Sutcliffiella deserti]|uniref:CaiB/BaiF CoA transferase family protein n=1 Tax=Sutcliffiella deserti TaxID=2875501 RepID=UPI001CBB5620|nr:CoA transferase [Sutcliffiella deserti]
MINNLLEGIRVIDFTNYLPGPFATQRLAELGAEVIKVEPLEGDPARNAGLKRNGTGIVYLANNRQKKSISMDLKKVSTKKRILELIETADVLLESFRPGVMEKLGLDYESVKKHNPQIVYCSLRGYGENGKWRKFGSHDLNYMALSGMLAQLKDTNGKPIHPSITLADYFGSFAACERVLAALLAKERGGLGGYHCLSITDVMASMMGNHLIIQEELGEERGISLLNGEIVSYSIYETKDQRYMSLGALEPKFWKNFCEAVNRPEWVCAHFTLKRETNSIYNEIQALFLTKSFLEWIEFSQEFDCCMAPVLEVGELEQFPYFKENETIFRNTEGHVEVRMHTSSSRIESKIPKLGEHNQAFKV